MLFICSILLLSLLFIYISCNNKINSIDSYYESNHVKGFPIPSNAKEYQLIEIGNKGYLAVSYRIEMKNTKDNWSDFPIYYKDELESYGWKESDISISEDYSDSKYKYCKDNQIVYVQFSNTMYDDFTEFILIYKPK